MPTIALCDDTCSDLKKLHDFIDDYAKDNCIQFTVYEFDCGESLLNSPLAFQCDILFLDIYMSGINGMDCAKMLQSKGYKGRFIFVTTSHEHAVDGFSIEALDYLVKPITYSRICISMERVLRYCKDAQISITITINSRQLTVPVNDIYFIETGNNHNSQLHLKHQLLHTTTLISDIEAQLTEFNNFLRCHRSYIVNMKYIDHIKDGEIILQSGEHVLVPVRKQAEIKKKIMEYLCWQMRR